MKFTYSAAQIRVKTSILWAIKKCTFYFQINVHHIKIASTWWRNWNVEMHQSFTNRNRPKKQRFLRLQLALHFWRITLLFGACIEMAYAAFTKATLTTFCKLTWQAKPFVHVISSFGARPTIVAAYMLEIFCGKPTRKSNWIKRSNRLTCHFAFAAIRNDHPLIRCTRTSMFAVNFLVIQPLNLSPNHAISNLIKDMSAYTLDMIEILKLCIWFLKTHYAYTIYWFVTQL